MKPCFTFPKVFLSAVTLCSSVWVIRNYYSYASALCELFHACLAQHSDRIRCTDEKCIVLWLFVCSRRLLHVPAVPLVALSSKGLAAVLALVVIVLEIPGLLSHPALLVQWLVIKSCTLHLYGILTTSCDSPTVVMEMHSSRWWTNVIVQHILFVAVSCDAALNTQMLVFSCVGFGRKRLRGNWVHGLLGSDRG